YAPEVVARAILDAAEHPQRDVYIGNAKLLSRLAQNAPRVADWVTRTFVYDTIKSGRADRHPRGALYASDVGSAGDGKASGDYPGMVLTRSLYTRASQHPVATTAAVAVGAAALFALLGRRAR